MILGMDGILEWLLCLPILCRISVGKCVPFSNNKQLYITVFHFESKKDSTNNNFFTRDNITDLFYDQPIPYTWGRPGTVSDISAVVAILWFRCFARNKYLLINK